MVNVNKAVGENLISAKTLPELLLEPIEKHRIKWCMETVPGVVNFTCWLIVQLFVLCASLS